MALPASFTKDGFGPIPKTKFKRLMIGSDGPTNTGKTEFILSAPGPGIVICLDRGFDAMLDNPYPPPTRRNDYAFKVITAPLATQALQDAYKKYWGDFYTVLKSATDNPDARVVGIDGDSDSWELQRLAEWGKLTGVGKSLIYAGVNAARRAMYARCWDSGKIIFATNKVAKHYRPVMAADGSFVLGDDKKPIKEWDGVSMERQGFSDQDYLWQIQLRHLFDAQKKRWGVRIMKAKAQPEVEGMELWGAECNFESLVTVIYPQVPLTEWGFK